MENFNTLHYVIAELKAYGIRNIISSPGTQNATFNYIVQEDPFFNCYSVVDERSAVYVACGISSETKEPTVITCTGATAARNYMSGMTEAYYSEIPVIALTFYDPNTNKYNLSPQYTDRSVSQNDIKTMSVHLPETRVQSDKNFVLTSVNAALSRAKYNSEPVHINCPSAYDYSIKTLPNDIWTTQYHFKNFETLKDELKNKKVAIMIGRHKKFKEEEQSAISDFVKSYNVAVFCEHMSNYNGANKILIGEFNKINRPDLKPDIVLDLGGISTIYNNNGLLSEAEYWSVVENYKYSCRESKKMTKLLNARIATIFSELKNDKEEKYTYFDILEKEVKNISFPDLPLSTALSVQKLAENIPNDTSLHLAILPVVQQCGFFRLPDNVSTFCNAGGFGIDGPVSTAVGQSLANPNKKTFCVTGDLAFFYDMNIIGNRHIGKNLRILLVNNNRGFTMRSNVHLEQNWGEKSDELVCAANHYKNGAKGWAESCDFEYLRASTKEEFLSQIKDFCNKDYDKPVLFEVFTDTNSEKEARRLLYGTVEVTSSKKKLSKIERIFSIYNEHTGSKKYKIVNFMGIKAKFKVKKKDN